MTVTATLDKGAAAFASDVQLSDLVQSGWTVAGPTPAGNGAVTFTVSKPFSDPAQAQAVIAQLSGPNGPFRDLTVVSHRSFFRTTTAFQGTVDLTCGLNCFSDPQLQKALGGTSSLGIDPSTLQGDAGIVLDQLFQFEIVARLPGTVTSNAAAAANAGSASASGSGSASASGSASGGGARWQVLLGQKTVLMASSRAWNVTHIVIVVVAGALLLLVIVLALVKLLRHRPGPRRPSGPRHGSSPRSGPRHGSRGRPRSRSRPSRSSPPAGATHRVAVTPPS